MLRIGENGRLLIETEKVIDFGGNIGPCVTIIMAKKCDLFEQTMTVPSAESILEIGDKITLL